MTPPQRLTHHLPLLLALSLAGSAASEDGAAAEGAGEISILLVVGAEGAEEYGAIFRETADRWEAAAAAGGARFAVIGLEPGRDDDREQVEAALLASAAEEEGGPLWVVLVGHGTFDGRAAKFNVRGPDFTDTDLAGWLEDFSRPLAVINTASSSAPFLQAMAGEGRVVITATKSAFEVFYTRFGEHFARAIGGLPEADLDNDQQVSLLEAFLYASSQVAEFYEREGRLATEMALLDDNGDGLGTRPDWFEGVRATRMARDGAEPDGELAHQFVLAPSPVERLMSPEQRTRRDDLEREVKALSRKRGDLGDEAFYDQVEPLLLEIARIYHSLEEAEPSPGPDGAGGDAP